MSIWCWQRIAFSKVLLFCCFLHTTFMLFCRLHYYCCTVPSSHQSLTQLESSFKTNKASMHETMFCLVQRLTFWLQKLYTYYHVILPILWVPKHEFKQKICLKFTLFFCEKLSKILRVYIAYLADHKWQKRDNMQKFQYYTVRENGASRTFFCLMSADCSSTLSL